MNASPRRPRTALALTAAVLGGALLLAGCSGDSSSDASQLASASAMPSGAMSSSAESIVGEGNLIGSDPATWAPVIIKPGESSLELVVGQVAIAPKFRYAKQSYIVESSDAAVASVSTPDSGQIVAVQAVAAGTTTITVYRGSGKANDGKGKVLAVVELTVSQQ